MPKGIWFVELTAEEPPDWGKSWMLTLNGKQVSQSAVSGWHGKRAIETIFVSTGSNNLKYELYQVSGSSVQFTVKIKATKIGNIS